MRRGRSAAGTAMKTLDDVPVAAAIGSSAARDRLPWRRLSAWFGGLGIKVKLPVAFAAVSIMTLAAAAVAITSFSATEQGVQNMAAREVPQTTDALRLSVISGEISAAAARFVNAKSADEQSALASRIRERYAGFTAILAHMRQGRKSTAFAPVEAPAHAPDVKLR